MKKVLSVILVLSVLFALGACSLFGGNKETTAAATNQNGAQSSTEPKENPNAPKMHTVTVTDENGKGFANVVVQISSDADESVAGGPTDENGVFSEELLKDESYIITLMMVPKGYVAQESYTFTDTNANIVLQPAEAAE